MRKEPINFQNVVGKIPIGQKIEVYVSEGNFEGTYSSFIYDLDDKFIYILMPTNTSGLKAVVRKGGSFYISFIDEKERRIGFKTTLNDIIKEEDRVIYKAERPKEEAYIMEFRENFRVDILAKADISFIKHSEISKGEATAIDISASGAKLSAGISLEDELEIGDTIFVSFELEGIALNNVESRIVRRTLSKGEKVNHYGIKFVNLDKKLEDRIIKFCIRKQLEMARKMKGLWE